MLTENDVVNAICDHLTIQGYTVVQRLSTTDHGIDIVLNIPQGTGRLLVEAKGGTSSIQTSTRYNKGFNRGQVFDRVAKGVYTGILMLTSERRTGDCVALAFPDTPHFRHFLKPVKPITDQLGVTVFLVQENPLRTVTVL